ncbi:hypothetical protein MN116_004105 [Schistosoma mekongi]|uniref:Uncharacterized protein n=1 Tax=Schistosoma mekongi TaxID=38744 RepID=A0AAE1ZGI9_SCHME|nr:hypothetical protein MN116_004105 [Schistosoma mekongi]
MRSFLTTATHLPYSSCTPSPSLPLSSITAQKLSNIEIIQEKDMHSDNHQLHPSERKLSLISPYQLTDNHVQLSPTTEINVPSTFIAMKNYVDTIKSNDSNRIVIKSTTHCQNIYQRLAKDCTGCNQPIIEKVYLGLSDGQSWHTNCLNCHTCGKCLDKETSCFSRYGQIYCRKDYEQVFGSHKFRSVCTRCRQLINPNELVVRSINQLVFHSDCFCCNICRRILKCGDRYEMDNINNHPVCWNHRQQRCDHHLNSVLGYLRQHETMNCSTENNQRDIEKTNELSNRIYSPNENTGLERFNDSGALFVRDTNHDAEDLPTESSPSINNVEPCNRLSFIDYGDQKQKSSVKSYSDKQLYKDEKYDRIRSYFIPMIGKFNSSVELLSNDLSHRQIHCLPPFNNQLSQTGSSNSSCNLMDKSLCKVESCSFNERLKSSHETLCSPYQSSTASAPSYSPSLFPSCTPTKTVSPYPSSTSCTSFTPVSIPNFANTSVTLLSVPSLSSSSSPPTPLSSGTRFIRKHLNISPLNYSQLLSGNDSSSLIDLMDSKNQLQVNTSIDSNILLQHTQQKRNRKRRSGIHHVFDDNCVNSGTNFYLGITTRQKRMRTSFKHHQLRTMKAYFSINHNPDVKDLKVLTEKTGLSKRVLQVWFQNARAKYRRNLVCQESTPTSVSNSNNNNNLSSSLVTSFNGGLSEIMGNSISECDSQSSQINPDDFTMSQTTLSSTSLHKNNIVQDFGDDIEDEEESGVDEINDTDDKVEINKVIGVFNKHEHQTKHNIQEIQCDNFNVIKFEDNPNCSYYHSHQLTNELNELTSHNENEQKIQQQPQSSINFSSFTRSINSSISHPSYLDNMLISQNNNNNLLHTNKIPLEDDNQLTTNVINYAEKQNNFILSNKCRTVNRFTLTGIHS